MGFALEISRGAGKVVQTGAPTLEQATITYVARPKLRSEEHKKGTARQFELHLKDWLRLPLNEITKAMVVKRHREMVNISSTANHTLRGFRAVWNHARRIHDLPESATMAIEWYEEKPDGRTIGDLVKWRETIDALDNPIHSAFFYFILFTGFRRTEALTLEWKNVHADHIHLPMTKNGRSFDLPITAIHHEILKPLRNLWAANGFSRLPNRQVGTSLLLVASGGHRMRIVEHLRPWQWNRGC